METSREHFDKALVILRKHMNTVPKHLRASTTIMLANHLMRATEKYRGKAMGAIDE